MSDREKWLAERRSHVTASDVAALLGESTFKTRDQLRMEKLGLDDGFSGNEHTDLALELEVPTIEIANRRFGWNAKPHGLGLVVDFECPRLAATPDATMETPWGLAVVQVKWTRSAAREDCKAVTKSGKESTAAYLQGAPIYYQLQVQAEMACTNTQNGVLLVMHHGQGLKLRAYHIPRHEGAIRRIRREVTQFWKEIESCQR